MGQTDGIENPALNHSQAELRASANNEDNNVSEVYL